MIRRGVSLLLSSMGLAWFASPWPVQACSACFGKSDSSLAVGMNWGIFSLLAVILCVLGGLAAFFIFLAKRSAMVGELENSLPATETNKKV